MAVLSENKIKEKVGDSWALIYNPVYSDKTGKFLKGNLIFSHKNKNKVYDFLAKDKTKRKVQTVLWFGKMDTEPILLNFF